MSNKPAKSNVTSATTTKRTQTVRPSITGASGTRKSRVNSNGPVPRALRKAQHDVERKLSRGQPSAEDDRPLRCLPYRTLNRAPKRELMRWNEDTYLHTLLATMWVLETRDIDVPWDEIAAVVHPGATGEAFKQALTKLRNRRVKEDLPVPPLRPGKGKSRGVCEEELEIMVALARSTRNKNAGRIEASSTTGNKGKGNAKAPWKQSSRAVNANDSELGFADMTVSGLVFCTILLPNALSSSLWAVTYFFAHEQDEDHYDVDEVQDTITDSAHSLTLQVVTGKITDIRERPSPAVSRLQARTNGLDIDMDIPSLASIHKDAGESENARLMCPSRRPTETISTLERAASTSGRGRTNSSTDRIGQQFPPSTPPAQKAALMQNLPFGFSTPPSQLRTPSECPPAPRDSSHSRKRSGDKLELPPSSPTPKRHTSDVTRNTTSRRQSLPQIPEFDPYQISPSQATPNLDRYALHRSDASNVIGSGGMGLPSYGYGYMNTGNLSMDNMDMGGMSMGNVPIQQMHPMVFQNMLHMMQLQSVNMQHSQLNNMGPVLMPPGIHQQQSSLRQGHGSQANINPLTLHNLTSQDFAPNSTRNTPYTRGNQVSVPAANHPSVQHSPSAGNPVGSSSLDQDDDMIDMTTQFTMGEGFFENHWNRDTPLPANERINGSFDDDLAPTPFQNLNIGLQSEDVKPDIGQSQDSDSQNTNSLQ
ncbi:hypothetical protein MPH_06771 [Macrophomina phaseolina MS6]|uniref:Uncharacterized protein n=1 Tax=Macrophomina phaseolina (strain MS6) TaxID=1126212 RepID=K2RTR6_MACPH|nr:hypothetical protein MPH_06771 [Macrophomina phaseolina MS6]